MKQRAGRRELSDPRTENIFALTNRLISISRLESLRAAFVVAGSISISDSGEILGWKKFLKLTRQIFELFPIRGGAN